MWEVCPVCHGDGYHPKVLLGPDAEQNVKQYCLVCKGKKIINKFTGYPPGPDPSEVKSDTGVDDPLKNVKFL
jgi:hypothetical protein